MVSLPPYNPFKLEEPQVQTTLDLIILGIGAALCLVFVLIPSFILLLPPWSVQYNAIRRKQPHLMFLAALCCAMWFVGSASANGFFRQESEVACVVANLWLYYYGVSGWSNILITRLICLFLTTQLNVKRAKIFPLLIWFVLMVPCTVLLVCASIFHKSFIKFQPERFDCKIQFPMTVGISSLIAVSIIILLSLTIFTCKTRKEFNESYVEIFGVFLIFLVSLFLIVGWTIRLNYLVPIRLMNAFQSIFLGIYYFIGVEGMVLYRLLTCQFKWFRAWDERFKQNTMLLLEEKQIKTQLRRERASVRHTHSRSRTAGFIHAVAYLLSCGGKLGFYKSMVNAEEKRHRAKYASQQPSDFAYLDNEGSSGDEGHFGGFTDADMVHVPPAAEFVEAEQTFGTEEKMIQGDQAYTEIYKPFL